MAVERIGNVAWESILPKVRSVLNEGGETTTQAEEQQIDEHFGEVLFMYRHIKRFRCK